VTAEHLHSVFDRAALAALRPLVVLRRASAFEVRENGVSLGDVTHSGIERGEEVDHRASR